MQIYKDLIGFTRSKVVFCGIDVHKKHWLLCFFCDGEVVEKVKMQANIFMLFSHLRRYYYSARSIRVVYEAGFSGTWLYRALINAGYECIITPPSLIPKSGSKVKTDSRDAEALARYHSSGHLKAVYILPKNIEADRGVLRLRAQLVRQMSSWKNRINSFLDLHGLQRPVEIKTKWSRQHNAWLETIEFEYKTDRFTLDQLIKNYRHLRQEIADVTRYIRQLSKQEEYSKNFKILTCLRGVGLITAMMFLLEIHDFSRFKNENRFSSYLGLTPSQYSSGEHVRLGHISRQGNVHLRHVLVESAWTVIRHCPHLGEKYKRIRAKGTNGKKAIVAVARSLAVRMRRCLLDQQNYAIGVC